MRRASESAWGRMGRRLSALLILMPLALGGEIRPGLVGAEPLPVPYRSFLEAAQATRLVWIESCADGSVTALSHDDRRRWSMLARGSRAAAVPSLVILGEEAREVSYVLTPGAGEADPWHQIVGPLEDRTFVGESLCRTMERLDETMAAPGSPT